MKLEWRARPDLHGSVWEAYHEGARFTVKRRNKPKTNGFRWDGGDQFVGKCDGRLVATDLTPMRTIEKMNEWFAAVGALSAEIRPF